VNPADQIDSLLLRLSRGEAESDIELATYLEAWLEARKATLAPSTHHGYGLMAKYYIDPHLGHLPLSQITVTHVAVWITTLLSSGGRRGGPLSASTVRYARLVHGGGELSW
jgi:integrase